MSMNRIQFQAGLSMREFQNRFSSTFSGSLRHVVNQAAS